MHYEFEWDKDKAQLNQQKHGVTFDEATSCFSDVFAIEAFDIDHSAAEDRFALIGMSEKERLVVVAFTLRNGNTIRVISARQATRKERKEYEEQTP